VTGRCRTPNCREVPGKPELGYCERCMPIVIRTGHGPDLQPPRSTWVERALANQLPTARAA